MQDISKLLGDAQSAGGEACRTLPPNASRCADRSYLECWLPAGHPVRFFNGIVEQELDVSQFVGKSAKNCRRGRPGYDRILLLRIVLYGYMVGIHSSRKLAQACIERVDFKYLTGGPAPSFSTITKFRARYAGALAELFAQSLSIATEDDMVEMRDVAFDGTKILANASKHKAMSHERMCENVRALHEEIQALKSERPAATSGRRAEIEYELEFKRKRFANLQQHKFALEDERMLETGEQPRAKDQRNFTDPESRIMKKGACFEQCYNAQAAVDKGSQIILAAFVTQSANDKKQLGPLAALTVENVGVLPDRALADAGYFSEAAIESIKQQFGATEWLVSPGRLAHGGKGEAPPRGRIPLNITATELMRRKLRTKAGKAAYSRRKTIVEPTFGQIKEATLEFRRFSFRGLKKVQQEWLLVCAMHNLLKVIRHRQRKSKVSSIIVTNPAA